MKLGWINIPEENAGQEIYQPQSRHPNGEQTLCKIANRDNEDVGEGRGRFILPII